jgi:hypothetical protein
LVRYPIVRNYIHSYITSQDKYWGFFLTTAEVAEKKE